MPASDLRHWRLLSSPHCLEVSIKGRCPSLLVVETGVEVVEAIVENEIVTSSARVVRLVQAVDVLILMKYKVFLFNGVQHDIVLLILDQDFKEIVFGQELPLGVLHLYHENL